MKNKIVLVAISLLFTSCATLFSNKNYDINVTSNSNNSSVKVNDKKYVLPAIINVTRSRDDLKLIFTNDSLQKEMTLKSRIRPYYFIGNLFFYPPISHLVDLNTQKRFYYKNNIFIKVKDTTVTFSKISLNKKVNSIFSESLKDETGILKLHLSLPHINHFSFNPTGESNKSSYGFLGISLGLDYFYLKNKFLSIQSDAKTNFEVPFPVPIFIEEGEYTKLSSFNFSVYDNKKLNKFSYGYGLNYAINVWNYTNKNYNDLTNNSTNYLSIKSKRRTNQNLGLHFNSYFKVSNNFYIGAVYQPSFVTFKSGPKLQYEHSISLDLAWKITIFNIKK